MCIHVTMIYLHLYFAFGDMRVPVHVSAIVLFLHFLVHVLVTIIAIFLFFFLAYAFYSMCIISLSRFCQDLDNTFG